MSNIRNTLIRNTLMSNIRNTLMLYLKKKSKVKTKF